MKRYKKLLSLVIVSLFLTVFAIITVKSLTQVKYTITKEVIGGTDEQVTILNPQTFYGNTNRIQAFNTEDSVFCFFSQDGYLVDSSKVDEQFRYYFRVNKDIHFTAYFKTSENFYVIFLSGNDRIISFQEVAPGESAISPNFTVDLEGYQFVRWNKDFTNVNEDLIIKPIYSKVKTSYTVTVEINNQINTIKSYEGEVLEFEAPKIVGETSYFSHWEVNGKKRSISNVLKISIYQNLEIKAIYSYAPHYEEIIAYLNEKIIFSEDKNRIYIMGAYDVRGNHEITEVGIMLLPKGETNFNLENSQAIKFTAQKINEGKEFAIAIPKQYNGYLVKVYVVEKTIKNNMNEFNQIFTDYYLEIK